MKFPVLLHISISLFEMYVDVPHCVFYDHDPPVNVLWDRHCYDNIIYIYDIYKWYVTAFFILEKSYSRKDMGIKKLVEIWILASTLTPFHADNPPAFPLKLLDHHYILSNYFFPMHHH